MVTYADHTFFRIGVHLIIYFNIICLNFPYIWTSCVAQVQVLYFRWSKDFWRFVSMYENNSSAQIFFFGNVRRTIFLLELLPSVRDIMTPRRRGISDSQDPDDSVKSSGLCKKIFKLIFCILLTQNRVCKWMKKGNKNI